MGCRSKRVVPNSPRSFTSGAFRGPRHEKFEKIRLVITSMIGNYYHRGRQAYRINVAFKPVGWARSMKDFK